MHIKVEAYYNRQNNVTCVSVREGVATWPNLRHVLHVIAWQGRRHSTETGESERQGEEQARQVAIGSIVWTYKQLPNEKKQIKTKYGKQQNTLYSSFLHFPVLPLHLLSLFACFVMICMDSNEK